VAKKRFATVSIFQVLIAKAAFVIIRKLVFVIQRLYLRNAMINPSIKRGIKRTLFSLPKIYDKSGLGGFYIHSL